jgi:hypothetical protein
MYVAVLLNMEILLFRVVADRSYGAGRTSDAAGAACGKRS